MVTEIGELMVIQSLVPLVPGNVYPPGRFFDADRVEHTSPPFLVVSGATEQDYRDWCAAHSDLPLQGTLTGHYYRISMD